jgi:hypothetical protein
MKPTGTHYAINVDTSQLEKAKGMLDETVSIAKEAGLNKRWTRKLLKMRMTRDDNQRDIGYQPTEETQTEPPNCGSSVQSNPPDRMFIYIAKIDEDDEPECGSATIYVREERLFAKTNA